jgi:hypothetical protein
MWRKFAIALVPVVVLGAATACAQVQGKRPSGGDAKAGPAGARADKKPGTPAYREHGSVQGVTPANPAQPKEPVKSADLLSVLARDLAQRLGVKPSELQVLAIEPVVWDDGSLGCPQPGQSYVMAQTPGVRVLFRNGGKTYQYHASDSGNFIYCSNPAEPAGSLDQK